MPMSFSSMILEILQLSHKIIGDAIQDGITVVRARKDQCSLMRLFVASSVQQWWILKIFRRWECEFFAVVNMIIKMKIGIKCDSKVPDWGWCLNMKPASSSQPATERSRHYGLTPPELQFYSHSISDDAWSSTFLSLRYGMSMTHPNYTTMKVKMKGKAEYHQHTLNQMLKWVHEICVRCSWFQSWINKMNGWITGLKGIH